MAAPARPPSMLYWGDNLDLLRDRDEFPSETIDLVYLDPPFNSNQNYNVLFAEQDGSRSAAQIRAFSDTWRWDVSAKHSFDEMVGVGGRTGAALVALRSLVGESDMLAYLAMMAPRLIELRRVLKQTGSLYLHCDPTASHYLKVLLDSVFEPDNFRNEIIWRRTGAHGPLRSFGPVHDTILFYSRSDAYFFEPVKKPYMRGHVETRYAPDETGRLKFTSGGNVLTGAGATKGESGALWRGFDPSVKDRHWAVPGFLTQQMPPKFRELGVLEKLETLYQAGLIEIASGAAWPTPKRYLEEGDGQPIQDIWAYQPYTEKTVFGTDDGVDADVAWLGPTDPERLDFDTQKPVGLLERIIRSSCPPSGVVLDPFCGCGTTIAAAQKLGRRWVGIDITHLSISLIRNRLADAYPDGVEYRVKGEPADVASAQALAKLDRYQFQWWALGKIGARPVPQERKKGADSGIDGKLFFREKQNGAIKTLLIQVKSGNLKLSEVRDFAHVIEREKAQVGVLLSLDEPTREMKTEAAGMGYYRPEYPLNPDDRYERYQILSIPQLLDGAKPHFPPFRNVTFKPAPEVKPTKRRGGRTHRLSAKSETGAEPRITLESIAHKEPESDE